MSVIWHELPNDFILAVNTVVAIIFSGSLMLFLYSTTKQRGLYQDKHVHMSVRGMKLLKFLTAFTAMVLLTLLAKVTVPETDVFFSSRAMMDGYWSIVRVSSGFFIFSACMMFDASPFFRILAIIGLPLMAAMDMVSQRAYVREINCMERKICTWSDDTLWWDNFWAIRDTVSCFCVLVLVAMCFWLGALFGYYENEIYMPRKEHRLLSRRFNVQSEALEKIPRATGS